MNDSRRTPEPVTPLIRHDPPVRPDYNDAATSGKQEPTEIFPIISEELFLAAKNGDAVAFGQIVELCEGRLFACAYQILHDVDAAKAIVQETLVRGHSHLTDIHNPIALYSYMRTATKHFALNHIRDQERHARLLDRHSTVFADIGATVPPDETAASREELVMLEKALQKLSENDRAILKLTADGLTNEEMAVKLSIPLKTARTRLFRARERLREMMIRRMGLAKDEPYRSTATGRKTE